MLPYLIFSTIAFILLFCHVPLHETGHALTILIISKIKKYKDIGPKIQIISLTKGFTHCKYSLFTNTEIKLIAIMSDVFALIISMLYSLAVYIFLHDLYPAFSVYSLMIIIPAVYIFLSYKWFFKAKPYNDKYIFQYPAEFKDWYTYPIN